MQNGPFIKERVMPGIIQDICRAGEIGFQAFSDDWVLRLEKAGQIRWVVGYKFDLNMSAAAELAQDKVATYMALDAAGVRAIEHYLIRGLSQDATQWHIHIPELHDGPVVLKPLSGTGGRDVERYGSVSEAVEVARHSGELAWAVSPYYEITAEYRLLMLGGQLLLSLEKTQPVQHGGLKLFNLGQGAVAADISDKALLGELQDMAGQVMRALSLRLAAVDIVRTDDGELRVLEVNDGIMLENYALQSAGYKDRATAVYDAVVTALFS